MKTLYKKAVIGSTILLLMGCGGGSSSSSNDGGAVYAMDNSATNNTIVAYDRAEDGTLTLIGSTSTNGQGTGPNNVVPGPGGVTFDPLASNYSLIMSENNDFVFAVNAGSNEITSFRVNDDRSLTLTSRVNTEGVDPISLATLGNAVYVASVNGAPGVIEGFTFDAEGNLTQIANSTRELTGRPTTIIFSENGEYLIANEIGAGRLQVFGVDGINLTETPNTFTYTDILAGRNNPNPFGLDTYSTDGDQFLVVGEARVFTADGVLAPQDSSISTLQISQGGGLEFVSRDVQVDGGIASCWVQINDDDNLAIVTNTNNNSVSSFSLAEGVATRLVNTAFANGPTNGDQTVLTGLTDSVTIDDYFYQLAAGTGDVISLSQNDDGTLVEIDRDSDLPTTGGSQGITGF